MTDEITLRIKYVLEANASCSGAFYNNDIDIKLPVKEAISLITKSQETYDYEELMGSVSEAVHQTIEKAIRRDVDYDMYDEEIANFGLEIFVDSEILTLERYNQLSRDKLIKMILRNPEKFGFLPNEDLPPIIRLYII